MLQVQNSRISAAKMRSCNAVATRTDFLVREARTTHRTRKLLQIGTCSYGLRHQEKAILLYGHSNIVRHARILSIGLLVV